MPTITIDLKELREMTQISDLDNLIKAIIQFKGEVKEASNDEMTVELEPDRPDLISVEGLARALRGYFEIETGLHKASTTKLRKSNLTVKVFNAKVRPHIACAIVKDLKLDNRAVRSLMRMQEGLHLTMGRDRRKVAIGFHDLSAIKPPIIYTEADAKTEITPLDMPIEMTLEEVLINHPKGELYKHLVQEGYPVYIDELGVFSFPPIINSERTRVTERTRDLFIELTGIDIKSVKQTLNVIIFNLIDRGGKIETVNVKYVDENKVEVTPILTPREMKVKVDEILNLIGIRINTNQIAKLLEKMRYGVADVTNNEIKILIPAYRVDVLHKVDVIEDVAIAYGYDELTPEIPSTVTAGKPSKMEIIEAKIRQSLIGLGLQEILTFTLSSSKLQTKKMNIEKLELVELENPITSELDVYRRWILPHLMRFLSLNKHVSYPQKIFELGYVAIPREGRIITLRNTSVAIASAKTSFTEIRGVLQAFTSDLGLEIKLRRIEHQSFIAGRTAAITVNNEAIGIIGEIHPQILNNFEIEVPVVAFEITHYNPTYPNSNEKALTIRDGVKATWLT